jgi:tetratricopeptide (TPR) repeat protein
MSQHALIELCKNESQKLLVQGQYELAIPGALQALRFSIEVYGANAVELVPSYLLLAESNLGLRRLSVAEEFLLYANWTVLKTPDCANELKAQLCRNFGKLYACQRRFPEALLQLAQDVYYCSLDAGPEHITAAAGYFYMGDVCLLQEQPDRAHIFFDKVVDVWYRFLAQLMQTPGGTVADYVSEAHQAEAVEMLKSVLAARVTHLGPSHLGATEAAYALAMLLHSCGLTAEALTYYLRAQAGYESLLGPEDPAVEAIQTAVEGLRAAEVAPSERVEEGTQGKEAGTGAGAGLLASKVD